MSSKLEWRLTRPYFLLLPVLVAIAVVAKAYYPEWGGCSSFSDADRGRVAAYVSTRYGLGDPSSVDVSAGPTMPGTCFRRLGIRAAKWTQAQTFFLSADKRYLFRQFEDLTGAPTAIAANAANTKTLSAPAKENPVDVAELVVGNPPSIGPTNSPVTLVEFSDFQCPYCKKMATTLTGQVLPEEKSRVRIVFRQFPLSFHSHAKEEAELSVCVARQSVPAFWALHDYLFTHQPTNKTADITAESMQFLHTQPGLNVETVQNCLSSHSASAEVDADIRLGQKYGVSGTPTLFINGIREVGARDEVTLKQLIDQQALAKNKPDNAVPTGKSAGKAGL